MHISMQISYVCLCVYVYVYGYILILQSIIGSICNYYICIPPWFATSGGIPTREIKNHLKQNHDGSMGVRTNLKMNTSGNCLFAEPQRCHPCGQVVIKRLCEANHLVFFLPLNHGFQGDCLGSIKNGLNMDIFPQKHQNSYLETRQLRSPDFFIVHHDPILQTLVSVIKHREKTP